MVIERRASMKSWRGPLKAIGNIGNSEDRRNLTGSNTTLPNQFRDDLQTPYQRVSSRPVQIRAPESMQNLLPMPLRTSSRRSEKSSKLSNDEGISDIRRHFPVRGPSLKMPLIDQNQKLTQTNDLGDSLINCSESPLSTDLYSFNSPPPRKRHSTALDIHHEIKQSRLDIPQSSPFQSLRTKHGTNSLTMGAGVKAHPRYHRRRSGASEILQFNEDLLTSSTNSHNRLAPICPVPMPLGFPSRLPPCVSVSLPWDSATTSVISTPSDLKTAQTQTSPIELQDRPGKTRGRRHTGFGRQSSGTMQIIHSIRKKFGHLRRAISADRLNRNSVGPEDLKLQVESRPNSASSSVQNEPVPDLHPLVAYRSSTSNDPVGTTHPTECRLSCQVKKKNSDGSVQIVLRRSSTAEQFGFFIAKDAQGIYVSRLGSVKCAAAVWNTFHVGDRILEVQGHKCTHLEVEDVQNLIRGCELVEFRIRSNRSISQKVPFR